MADGSVCGDEWGFGGEYVGRGAGEAVGARREDDLGGGAEGDLRRDQGTYDAQADPRYGAARLWIDAIIDPVKTREVLMTALEAAALNPEVARFNPGVLQT